MAAFMLLTAASPAPARIMDRKSTTGALVPTCMVRKRRTQRSVIVGMPGWVHVDKASMLSRRAGLLGSCTVPELASDAPPRRRSRHPAPCCRQLPAPPAPAAPPAAARWLQPAAPPAQVALTCVTCIWNQHPCAQPDTMKFAGQAIPLGIARLHLVGDIQLQPPLSRRPMLL